MIYSVLYYDSMFNHAILIVSNIQQRGSNTIAYIHFYIGHDSKLTEKDYSNRIHTQYVRREDFDSLEEAVSSVFVDIL